MDGRMSLYALQKLIRDVNRKPACRDAYFQSAEKFAATYELAADERAALVGMNIGQLYAMGVHGLLLRPFTLLHKMPEPDYLKAIRGE
jgi:Aromatic-ring-opening dioxygenase LigAB, LigA subunit